MVMEGFSQPNCVNGITKKDALIIKSLDSRVSALENGKDWVLFEDSDWSQFSTDGKANQDLILKISVALTAPQATIPIVEFRRIFKGDDFSDVKITDGINTFGSFYSVGDGESSSTNIFYVGFGIATNDISENVGNTEILTGETIKLVCKGFVYQTYSPSQTTTPIWISSWNRQRYSNTQYDTLPKNGTQNYYINLYYRPTESE